MTTDNLEQKLAAKAARIGIIGLGYVGLPLATAFSNAGLNVLGFDVAPDKVSMVNEGKSYILDVSAEALSSVHDRGLLRATTDLSRLSTVDVACVCVPTPLTKTKDPDLSYVIQTAENLSEHLVPGQLVILESTTYPGTTREVVLPILERSGLKAGRDFHLAFSPERVDPGNRTYNVKNTPKLVGGIDQASTRLAELLYRNVADVVIPVSSPEVAELTKVFENVFRSVNIALANELAKLCERIGVSVWEVIGAASSKPFGYMPFYPGPGIGGHCIPLDPYYLANKARELDFHTRFIELAAEINEDMPYHVVSRVMESLNARGKSLKHAGVLVLGVAYKKDVPDVRESPALRVIEILLQKGADISYNDPHVPQLKVGHHSFASVELNQASLSAADCVLITTNHSAYDVNEIMRHARFIFDTRGMTRGWSSDKIVRLGE